MESVRHVRFALLVAAVAIAGFGAGHEAHRREWIPLAARQEMLGWLGATEEEAPHGWSFARCPVGSSAELGDAAEVVGTLGYLGGYRTAGERDHVTSHDRGSSHDGLNLYVSGHAPEAILMEMDGSTIHRWQHDFRAQWPEVGPLPYFGDEGQTYWRRAHLYGNGDLLAIYDGFGLVKLDRDSRVIWSRVGGYHHDLQVMDNGQIFVLDREIHLLPRWNESVPLVEDFVAVLAGDGSIVSRVSLLECFERSRFAPVLESMPRRGDVFHTNTLQVLDGSHEAAAFAAGNVLVSIRELNTVAVVDIGKREVVWCLGGQWVKQHQPELLPNGNLLVFDNRGWKGKSRVAEMDLLGQELVWSYAGTPQAPLESDLLGSCQRLANGNTLITESTNGRALEVTPGGRVVWEFWNPHRAGENRELVANLFEVIRVDRATWLAPAGAPAALQ